MGEIKREIVGKYVCIAAEIESWGYPEDNGYSYYDLKECNFTFVPYYERDKDRQGSEYFERFKLKAPTEMFKIGEAYNLQVIETTKTQTYTSVSYEAVK